MSTSIPLPPSNRTHLGRALGKASQLGKLVLQHCDDCKEIQYPPREVCVSCLSAALSWREINSRGTVLATTSLHISLEPHFQTSLPWRMASVKLQCGPVVLASNREAFSAGEDVNLVAEQDNQGNILLATKA